MRCPDSVQNIPVWDHLCNYCATTLENWKLMTTRRAFQSAVRRYFDEQRVFRQSGLLRIARYPPESAANRKRESQIAKTLFRMRLIGFPEPRTQPFKSVFARTSTFPPAEEPQIIRWPAPSTPSRSRQSSGHCGPLRSQRCQRCRTSPARS